MADIFNAAPTPAAPASLADLVGEDKKFKSVEDLAKGKVEADSFITQLQEENRNLREAANKGVNAADNLAELRNELNALKAQLSSKKSDEPSPNTTGALTADQLEGLVSSVITKQEQARTANQNIAATNDAMIRQFGGADKAQEVFNRKASENGMSVADLKAIAAKSPTAFFSLMGVNPNAEPKLKGPDLQKSSLNTGALPTNGGPKPGSEKYFTNLRREMGNAAFFADKRLQRQVWEAKKSGLYDAV